MNRYREDRDETTTAEVTWTGSTSGTAWKTTMPNRVKTIADVVVPRFHSRIKSGEIINNPATITNDNESMPAGTFTYKRVYDDPETEDWETNFTGPIYPYLTRDHKPVFDLSFSTGLDLTAMAKQKALSNIDSTPYSFAEDLAEIRTTARHLFSRGRDLKNLNTSFSKAVKNLKRRTRKESAAVVARETSQLYLEYRFAVSPLIRSIADLIEASNEKLGSREKRETARGFEVHRSNISSTVPFHNPSLGFMAKAVVNHEEIVSAGILYSVTNPLKGFRFKYGLRNKDIPVTMWAIVPYSFMVDRVFNISQALRAITNLWDPDVHIHTAWCRSSVTTSYQYSCDGVYPEQLLTSLRTRTVSGSAHKVESFKYTRKPWTPSITDAIPTPTWVKLVDSFTKIADITALTHVNLKQGRK